MKMEKAQYYQEFEWCPGAESNHRHEDFQSTALPLSYPGMGEGCAFGWMRSRRARAGCLEGISKNQWGFCCSCSSASRASSMSAGSEEGTA